MARYINARTGEIVDSLPEGASVVDYRNGLALPKWKEHEQKKNEDGAKWVNYALAGGSGLLAHTIASNLFDDKTEEEKKKESLWMKVVRNLLPIGAGAAAAYGGYRLGEGLNKGAEAGVFYTDESANAAADKLNDDASSIDWKKWLGPYALTGIGFGYGGYNGAQMIRTWLAKRKLPTVNAGIQQARVAAGREIPRANTPERVVYDEFMRKQKGYVKQMVNHPIDRASKIKTGLGLGVGALSWLAGKRMGAKADEMREEAAHLMDPDRKED